MAINQHQTVSPSIKPRPLLATDGLEVEDPGELDDNPGIDDIEAMEDVMPLPVRGPETVQAPSDPNREPPRVARRASGAAGSVEVARAPADTASVVATGVDGEDSLIQRGVFGKRTPKTLSEPYVPTQAAVSYTHLRAHET